MLALALFGYTTFRHLPVRFPPKWRQTLRQIMNCAFFARSMEEIVSLLPLGLLVTQSGSKWYGYEQQNCQSPAAAFKYCRNITNMAERHQGIIPATINNELYEWDSFAAKFPRTQIFIIRDQDREVLVNREAETSAAAVENQQARRPYARILAAR
ncbi:hypothetical protein ACNKHK_14675 [Shigella flexneri]